MPCDLTFEAAIKEKLVCGASADKVVSDLQALLAPCVKPAAARVSLLIWPVAPWILGLVHLP